MALTSKSTTSRTAKKTAAPEQTAAQKEAEQRREALAAPAEIPAATDFGPSGAPRQGTDVDVDHPAVDNDPRAGTSVAQNMAEMNDPRLSDAEAVAENLRKQGVPTKSAEASE